MPGRHRAGPCSTPEVSHRPVHANIPEVISRRRGSLRTNAALVMKGNGPVNGATELLAGRVYVPRRVPVD